MPSNEITRVRESYQRCLKNPEFFPKFYERFIAHGEDVRRHFAKTDMEHQMRALRDGLQYMIMFADGSKIAAAKVEDLGYTHDRAHRNIAPELYGVWLESLVSTIRAVDPLCNDELAADWSNVMSHGIVRLKAMY